MAEGYNFAIKLDPAQFLGPAQAIQRSFVGMQQGIAQMASGAQSSFSKVTGGITGLYGRIASLIPALGGLGAAFELTRQFAGAMEKAMAKEKMIAGFTAILGNADAAAGMLSGLKAAAKGSEVSFESLANAAKQMLHEGDQPMEIISTLKEFVAISNGAGPSVEELTRSFEMAREEGTVTDRVFHELVSTVRGLGPALSAITGIRVRDLKDAAGEGLIRFDDLREALKRLTSQGGTYFGSTKAAMNTNLGLIAEIKRSYGQIVSLLASPVNDALKPLLQYVVERMHDAAAACQIFVSAMGVAIQQGIVLSSIGDLISLGLKTAANAILHLFDPSVASALAQGLVSAIATAVKFGAAAFGVLQAGLSKMRIFDFLVDGKFWSIVGRSAEVALMRAANAFDQALLKAAARINDMLPKFLQGNNTLGALSTSVVGRGKVLADRQDALTKEGGDYLNKQGVADKLKEGIQAMLEEFGKKVKIEGGQLDTSEEAKHLNKLIADAQKALTDQQKKQTDALKAAGDEAAKAANAAGGVKLQTKEYTESLNRLRNRMLGLPDDATPGQGQGQGGHAPGKIHNTGAMDSAVKSFFKLSPSEMKKYDGTMFGGKKVSTDEAFKNYLKDQSWRMPAIQREIDQKNIKKKGPAGIKNLQDFLKDKPADFFRGMPGQKDLQKGKDSDSMLARFLEEIATNTRGLKVI